MGPPFWCGVGGHPEGPHGDSGEAASEIQACQLPATEGQGDQAQGKMQDNGKA